MSTRPTEAPDKRNFLCPSRSGSDEGRVKVQVGRFALVQTDHFLSSQPRDVGTETAGSPLRSRPFPRPPKGTEVPGACSLPRANKRISYRKWTAADGTHGFPNERHVAACAPSKSARALNANCFQVSNSSLQPQCLCSRDVQSLPRWPLYGRGFLGCVTPSKRAPKGSVPLLRCVLLTACVDAANVCRERQAVRAQ